MVIVVVALGSLIITGGVGLRTGSDLGDRVLRDRLVTIAASRGDQVQRFIEGVQRQTVALAISPRTSDVITEFGDAFRELLNEPVPETTTAALTDYYRSVIAPELEAVRARPVSASGLVPKRDAAIRLQHAYVLPQGPDAPDPSLIDDAGDGSRWSTIHASVHPAYRDIADRSGFSDLYLIDAREDVIVYSVSKGIELATSLDGGPESGSTLSEIVDALESDPAPGRVIVADFARYVGATDRPVLFVAAAVMSGDRMIGAVAVQIDSSQLNEIMTNGDDWTGFGDTGETYVAAADGTMRSDARSFVENRSDYLAVVGQDGEVDPDQLRAMQDYGTTVLFQPVNRRVVQTALSDGAGIGSTTNYRGDSVLSAHRPLGIEGLDWVVLAEVGRSEVEQPISDYARNLLIAVAVIIVVLTFVAVQWSRRLVAPLRIISARLRAVRSEADRTPTPVPLPVGSPREFVELAEDIDVMMDSLAERRAETARRTAERVSLLHKFLPRLVAERAEAGEQDILDVIPSASVVVVILRGLGELVRSDSREEVRNLLDRLIDEMDVLARQHGLDRMKISGDAYYASCGVSRTQPDHTSRTVRFALALVELVLEIVEDDDHALSVGVGVDSGSVTVGLTGGTRFIYETWGPTVTNAAHLARAAPDGQVLVSASARAQLPPDLVCVDHSGSTSDVGTAVVTGCLVDDQEAT